MPIPAEASVRSTSSLMVRTLLSLAPHGKGTVRWHTVSSVSQPWRNDVPAFRSDDISPRHGPDRHRRESSDCISGGNRQSGLLMRLGSLSHLASDLLGPQESPVRACRPRSQPFPCRQGRIRGPRLAHARENGLFKPIIWHIRTTFRRKAFTSLACPTCRTFTSISHRVSYGRVWR